MARDRYAPKPPGLPLAASAPAGTPARNRGPGGHGLLPGLASGTPHGFLRLPRHGGSIARASRDRISSRAAAAHSDTLPLLIAPAHCVSSLYFVAHDPPTLAVLVKAGLVMLGFLRIAPRSACGSEASQATGRTGDSAQPQLRRAEIAGASGNSPWGSRRRPWTGSETVMKFSSRCVLSRRARCSTRLYSTLGLGLGSLACLASLAGFRLALARSKIGAARS